MQLPIRLFHLLPGKNLENFPFTPDLCFQIGALLAKMHKCFDSLNVKKLAKSFTIRIYMIFKNEHYFRSKESHVPFISPENHECLERLLTKFLFTKVYLILLFISFQDFISLSDIGYYSNFPIQRSSNLGGEKNALKGSIRFGVNNF